MKNLNKCKKTHIYLVTLQGTDKCYVGITQQNPKDRWTSHRSSARNGSQWPFHRALRKYGPDAFNWEHVATCLTWKDACDWETWFISSGSSYYNCSMGGEGAPGVKRNACTRKRMSQAQKGRQVSESCRRLLSEATKLQWLTSDPRTGRKHTDETKKKISNAKKGHKQTHDVNMRRSTTMKETLRRKKEKLQLIAAMGNSGQVVADG